MASLPFLALAATCVAAIGAQQVAGYRRARIQAAALDGFLRDRGPGVLVDARAGKPLERPPVASPQEPE